MPKTPIQILIEIRDLFQDRSKWTDHAYARERDGFECDPKSSSATCWCLTGAINMKADNSQQRLELRKLLYPFTDNNDLAYVNDYDGYEAVLQLLDMAIAHVQN